MTSTPKHFISNKDLTASLVNWSDAHRAARASQQPLPPMPDDIGEAIMRIATKYSQKPNFCNYTFKQDMIADAALACVTYLHMFNPQKSMNGFAYITQITHNSFVRRIELEGTHTYKKAKLAQGNPNYPHLQEQGDEIIERKEAKMKKISDKMKAKRVASEVV